MRVAAVLVLLFSGLMLGCLGKLAAPRPPSAYSAQYWGRVSALRNGRALQNPRIWAATRSPCHKHAFDIFITEFNDQGEELLLFTLANIPQRTCTINRFKVDYSNLFCTTDTVGSTLTAKLPVGFAGTYKPCRIGNKLVITAFDSVKKEIKGTFLLSLVVDQRQSGKLPDTIHIEQGQFNTKLRGPSGTYE